MDINFSRLKEIVGDDIELVSELIELYDTSIQNSISKMEGSCSAESPENDKVWADTVHELKGASYSLGLNPIADYLTEFEHLEGNIDAKKQVINQLKSVHQKFLELKEGN